MYKNAADILPRYLVEEIQSMSREKKSTFPNSPTNASAGRAERNQTVAQHAQSGNQRKYREELLVEALMESTTSVTRVSVGCEGMSTTAAQDSGGRFFFMVY